MEKQSYSQAVTDLPLSLEAYRKRIGLSDALLNRLFLVVAMTAGAAIRLWQINVFGLNSDEAVYSGQAAAMAQIAYLKGFFPVFRAHPLLYQFLLALVFGRFGVSDLWPRLLGAAFGVATIFVVYLLGSLLYGKKAGAIAALFMALMPYHVIVTRQGLLDGPLVFCSTLTLYFLAKFVLTERPMWLYVTGIGMGLTFLAKETGIVLLGSIYAFLALSREVKVRIQDIFISLCFMVVMISPYAISMWLSGAASTGQSYFIWQLFRRPNHTLDFYLTSVPPAIGILVILTAFAGLVLLWRERSWRERLLVWWILVPVVFFELWPTKGFQYLLPIAPAIAILAARTLVHWSPLKETSSSGERLIKSVVSEWVPGVIALTLLITSWQAIRPQASTTFTAGTGGIPGVREAGTWISQHTPKGAVVLTIGPSMANMLRFYGQRAAYGLSISPNPLYRNPAYVPVLNPDLQVRNGDIQYLVWDSFSASRSQFFSDTLMRLSRRFNGRVVHTESIPVRLADGTTVQKPVIIIFEVHR
jgi:hypothetical protein